MTMPLTNRIEKKLAELTAAGRKALIPFIVAGDPDLRTSLEIARAILHNGADILEIGVPFSDPSADGPTIMAADSRSLAQGTSIVDTFNLVRDLRKDTQKPILFLLYYNTVVQMGLEMFFATCREVGVDGVIIPDLPLEEQDEAGPLSGERLPSLTSGARGFLYCVAALGVTGERSELSADLARFEQELRSVSPIPRALGFGISTPEQVRDLAAGWDAIIVGSAIVRRIGEGAEEGLDAHQLASRLGDYVASLRTALDEGTLAAQG
jgi:tryptophan synthase alpha chain